MIRHTLLLLALCASSSFAGAPSLANYVNTLQGTNSNFELTRGNTYPATGMPFGMNLWSPQTGPNGDGWKYQFSKDTIRGFQQAHQCSSWTNDYAVFSLMPVAGKLTVNENERATRFTHADEVARPYCYRVKLGSGVTTEMSATDRSAMLRFSFPATKDAFVVLDGYTKASGVKILPAERKIVGWVNNGRQVPENFRNYFAIVFDQPFLAQGTWENRNNTISPDKLEGEGDGVGAFVQFKQGALVQAKVSSSYISTEQAELNLSHELGKFTSLDDVRDFAEAAWNKYLSAVTVEGGTEEEKATFYSCFFHASLFPRQFFEYDAAMKPHYYSPYDGKVHQGYMFTDTGFWDTFRAQFPLNTILHPTMQGRYMNALLAAYQQCGWLPEWSFPGEGGSMIGNHVISLFADAWVKGIRTFDPGEAVRAYFHEATEKGPWGPANGRDGWKDYYQLGFVPYPEHREGTAKTLEYAYDDFCGYQLAKMTGQPFYSEVFARQMYNYRNVFDPGTGFMRGRDSRGNFTPNFDPTEWGGPFTEGCAWHWEWSVFHDIGGLINLIGGDRKFIEKLDGVFTATNQYKVGTYGSPIHEMREMTMANMGQYAHGNQPIQHMIYLYNYAGEPWKAQRHVRTAMEKLYSSGKDGYPGDEDQGQTSSWYVLSALGFYSVCPGTDEYVIGSPVFSKATISLENGKKFTVLAKDNSKTNVYIQSARLNGKPYSRNFILHKDIVDGGTLELEMGPQPNLKRGTSLEDRPFSLSPYPTPAGNTATTAQ